MLLITVNCGLYFAMYPEAVPTKSANLVRDTNVHDRAGLGHTDGVNIHSDTIVGLPKNLTEGPPTSPRPTTIVTSFDIAFIPLGLNLRSRCRSFVRLSVGTQLANTVCVAVSV